MKTEPTNTGSMIISSNNNGKLQSLASLQIVLVPKKHNMKMHCSTMYKPDKTISNCIGCRFKEDIETTNR